MKNNLIILFLVLSVLSIESTNAQANLEITVPSGCETGSCFVDFPLNPIEAGLSDVTTVTITNNNPGGAPLSGSYEVISFTGAPTCSECAYFSFVGGVSTFNLNFGDTQDIEIMFSPPVDVPTLGGITVKLRITVSNDESTIGPNYPDADGTTSELDVDIRVDGEVKKTSINYSIVLDRSGSMQLMEADGLGGFKRRIDLVSEAADYFLGLEYLRVEDLSSGFPGDKIGIVKYNNSVDGTYLPLSTATNTLLSDAQTNLVSTAATNDIAFIRPQGSTATGNAVIESINTHLTTVASGDEQNVIIMLSDGYENTGSLITDVGAGSVSDEITLRPDINIYSIGMGNANMASLEQYSNLSGLAAPQTFYYDPTLDPMALNSFFFKIYQNAIGLASVIDPTYYVNLVSEDWVDIAEATISSSDQQITISITYPEEIGDVTDFRIIQPSGVTLAEGDIDGVNTVKVEGRNHIIYQVTFSSTADPTSYVGEWELQGKSTSKERSDVNLSNVPVGFAVASLSGLTIDVNAGTGDIQPGDEIVITVEPEDSSNPDNEVEIEDIDVSVTTPDGKEVGCPPERDPCGTYVVKFPHTHKKGIYEVYVKTTLRNAKGELTMRDAYQQVVVSKEKEILASDTQPCLACKWIQILIVISIIIFILLLILMLRKRKG
ncbi:MAG: vWA domain-containing protein [Cyclobacteriaceae bacterium]